MVIGAAVDRRTGATRTAEMDRTDDDELGPEDLGLLVPPKSRRDIWMTELESRP